MFRWRVSLTSNSTKRFTRQFLVIVEKLWQKVSSISSISFHHYINYLAQRDRLERQYTQNSDWIENQLSSLSHDRENSNRRFRTNCSKIVQRLSWKKSWSSTIHLHDQLDDMQCHKCDMFYSTIAESFQDSIFSLCLTCQKLNERESKRALNVDHMRLNILLYEKKTSNQKVIESVCASDIRVEVDVVLIVEIKLYVRRAQRLAIELCQSIRISFREKAIIWISKNPSSKTHQHLFDVIVVEDCDNFVERGALTDQCLKF